MDLTVVCLPNALMPGTQQYGKQANITTNTKNRINVLNLEINIKIIFPSFLFVCVVGWFSKTEPLHSPGSSGTPCVD